MDYEYKKLGENEGLYDDYNLSMTKKVKAEYQQAVIPCDRGNPLLEALPRPLDEADVITYYSKGIVDYSSDDNKKMSLSEKRISIAQLRDLRFCLPFHEDLEYQFYNAVTESYRHRTIMSAKKSELNVEGEGNSIVTKTLGKSEDAANIGFALIGYSGCGKSSAISTLTSHIPQVIEHDLDDAHITQIVWLLVNCMPNSNFSALYTEIGAAIDKALGNVEPFYAKEVGRRGSLGLKLAKVKELVETFSIGIIIFDEIQLMNFDNAKENSFDTLLTLNNTTKVAIAAVGTEDAYASMFPNLRTARRIGNIIDGSTYCGDKKYFSFIAKNLFNYYWFDAKVSLTNNMIDALYDNTKGIVDQLIRLYMCMHVDYFKKLPNAPIVDEEFINNVYHNYFKGLESLMKTINTKTERSRVLVMEKIDATLDKEIAKGKEQKSAAKIMGSAKTVKDIGYLKNCVVRNIQTVTENYNQSTIEDAFTKAIRGKDINKIDEKALTQDVMKRLMKGTTDKKPKKGKKEKFEQTNKMRNALEGLTEEIKKKD